MAYETFERTSVRVEEPALSFGPDGRITLNAAAARILAEVAMKSVLLLWDNTDRKVAIKGTSKSDKNAYAVSFTRGTQAASLRAKLFFNYIGWAAPRRVVLPATWDPKERMLEVTLPREFVGSVRAKEMKQRAKTTD
jgi:hypothetical protein